MRGGREEGENEATSHHSLPPPPNPCLPLAQVSAHPVPSYFLSPSATVAQTILPPNASHLGLPGAQLASSGWCWEGGRCGCGPGQLPVSGRGRNCRGEGMKPERRVGRSQSSLWTMGGGGGGMGGGESKTSSLGSRGRLSSRKKGS